MSFQNSKSSQTVCWPHFNNKNRWLWNFRELEADYLPGEPNSKLVTALFYKTVPAENHKNHKSNTRAETDISTRQPSLSLNVSFSTVSQ